MNNKFTLLAVLLFCGGMLNAQSTTIRVYEILQQKCAGCHNNAMPQSGLDLEGNGATVQERAADVYNNIVNISPSNSHANSKGYKYIYPGRADLSYVFRKINGNLEETIVMDANEEGIMPPYGETQLTNVEKEMIRQWILYGSPENGTVVDEQVIDDYYNVNGLASFPDGPPPAPDPSEGFQIKMGPFFLPPSGQPGSEVEYFQKYELDMPANQDIDRLDMEISNYSHHLILYKFDDNADNIMPGFRLDNNHSDISFVATVAESQDMRLPEGTAFIWDSQTVLDLNSHYINYSAGNTYKAEAYINVYTKPEGTALHEMQATLIPNPSIFIPNNGNEVTFTDEVTYPAQLYVWAAGGHTHKYGTDYKIWKRLPNGQPGELIYDGSCPQGEPGCVSPYFDYQHIPVRYYDNFLPVNMSEGIIHQASYVNDGDSPVWWGPTSEDEMMLIAVMFVTDTTGLNLDTTTPIRDIQSLEGVSVFPNPMQQQTIIQLPADVGNVNIKLYDVFGKELRQFATSDETILLSKDNLSSGMYIFRIEDKKGRIHTGKLLIE